MSGTYQFRYHLKTVRAYLLQEAFQQLKERSIDLIPSQFLKPFLIWVGRKAIGSPARLDHRVYGCAAHTLWLLWSEQTQHGVELNQRSEPHEVGVQLAVVVFIVHGDRKSTRLNSSH